MPMNLESNHYIIGLVTEHGVIPLDVGRRYGQVAAQLRAEELELTQEAEKKALQGIKFVALSSVIDLE
jgi:hypothetical protein